MDALQLQSQANIPTEYGEFNVLAFAKRSGEKMPHIALVSPRIDVKKAVVVRIHSECMTGDVFHSLKCDCQQQLEESLKYVQEHNGVVVYLRQEGRGIGLIEKLKAYELQDQGYDTVDANLKLGHQADMRSYSDAIQILNFLEINSVKLLTNNPEKMDAFQDSEIELKERISIVLPPSTHNEEYFKTKKNRMGHIF